MSFNIFLNKIVISSTYIVLGYSFQNMFQNTFNDENHHTIHCSLALTKYINWVMF